MSAIAFCARTLLPASSSGGEIDGDAELAGRHGDEAAADAALGRQPRVIQPLAGVVVQSRRRHDGEHARHLGSRPSPAFPVTGFLPPFASVAAIVARSLALTPTEHCRV